jgi:hypothetical protein
VETPAPVFLGAGALVDEEEVPGGQGGDGTPDCERPLSRETNDSRPTERLRQPGEHHKVGMKRLGVLVALPPESDSYAVVEPSLEAWEELGNDRDRGDSSKALKQRLSQLAVL